MWLFSTGSTLRTAGRGPVLLANDAVEHMIIFPWIGKISEAL